MSPQITWDAPEDRRFETGTDHGVLYTPDDAGSYTDGVAWNGITAVTETPSGAEPTPVYADNIKYLNMISVEEFGGTIEAYTFPDEFLQFDGGIAVGGVTVHQQNRGQFGLSYRSRIGNAVVGDTLGYKLHFLYGLQVKPSERGYTTVNDSPEAMSLSWEFTTNPVNVDGMKPTALLTVDSTKTPADKLEALEAILYGSESTAARLPLPNEVLTLLAAEAVPVAPTFDDPIVTIPASSMVDYTVDGVKVTGTYTVPSGSSKTVEAKAKPGYTIPTAATKTWSFTAA